jgi:hypothetical protein
VCRSLTLLSRRSKPELLDRSSVEEFAKRGPLQPCWPQRGSPPRALIWIVVDDGCLRRDFARDGGCEVPIVSCLNSCPGETADGNALAIFHGLGLLNTQLPNLFFEQRWHVASTCAESLIKKVLENTMNKLVFSLVASVVLVVAAPASAQVFIGADSGGSGVNLVRLFGRWLLSSQGL